MMIMMAMLRCVVSIPSGRLANLPAHSASFAFEAVFGQLRFAFVVAVELFKL